MAKTVLVLIVLVMFSIGLFIVSKVGVFLKESKKEASDEREGVQLVKILEGIPGERTKVNMNIQDSAWTKRQKNHHPIYIEKPSIKDYLLTFSIFVGCTVIGLVFQKLHFTDINIVTVYILGVLVTSIVTDGYLCGLVGSFLSVVLFVFSYGATNVLSNICSWLSGDIFNNVDIFSAYRNSCCQIKRSCPVI